MHMSSCDYIEITYNGNISILNTYDYSYNTDNTIDENTHNNYKNLMWFSEHTKQQVNK